MMSSKQQATAEAEETRWAVFKDRLGRGWYKFSRNPTSLIGAAMVLLFVFLASFAHYVTPYPNHAGAYTDFPNAFQPPSAAHWCGTDSLGADVLTRIAFGSQISFMLAGVVLGISVPLGVWKDRGSNYENHRHILVLAGLGDGLGDLCCVHSEHRQGNDRRRIHLVDMALPLGQRNHSLHQDGGSRWMPGLSSWWEPG